MQARPLYIVSLSLLGLVGEACTIGPKLVTTPMLEAAPWTPPSLDPETQTTEDFATGGGELSGTWQGRAWQVGNKSWPLTVTFEKPQGDSVVAHAQYPDQRCSADWKLRSSEARHWQGEELVQTDPFRRCADHGRVTLELIDEETINWRRTGSGITASATLERNPH